MDRGRTRSSPTPPAALGWLDAERANLLAAVRPAATTPGVPAEMAVQLATPCSPSSRCGATPQDWVQVNQTALGIARRLGDRAAQAQAHNDLGLGHSRHGSLPGERWPATSRAWPSAGGWATSRGQAASWSTSATSMSCRPPRPGTNLPGGEPGPLPGSWATAAARPPACRSWRLHPPGARPPGGGQGALAARPGPVRAVADHGRRPGPRPAGGLTRPAGSAALAQVSAGAEWWTPAPGFTFSARKPADHGGTDADRDVPGRNDDRV